MPNYILGTPSSNQYFDDNGDPAENHTFEYFVTGTSTPATVAFDSAGVSTATSTTVGAEGFQENGGTPVSIYFDDSVTYDIVRKDSGGTAYGNTVTGYTVANTENDGAQSVLSKSGSAANVITADISPAPASLADQQQVVVELQHGANTTTTPTFNLNSLGAVTIVRDTNDPLIAGDTGGIGYKLQLNYSAALSAWVLLNPANANNNEYPQMITVTGASTQDALVADLPIPPSSLYAGLALRVRVTHAGNATATPTFNLNSLGAKPIKRLGGNDLKADDTEGLNSIIDLVYDGTNWELLNYKIQSNVNIEDGAITSAKLATGAVNAAAIRDGGVTQSAIGSGAVVFGKIAADAVRSSEIGAGSITVTKIANATAAGAAAGELITWGADNIASTVGVGTSGQVLQSNGAGSPPSMQTLEPVDIQVTNNNRILGNDNGSNQGAQELQASDVLALLGFVQTTIAAENINVKIPIDDKLIAVQVGKKTLTGSTLATTCTFASTFAAIPAVFTNPMFSGQSSDHTSAFNIGTTTFDVHPTNSMVSNGGVGSLSMQWIAIGQAQF